MENLKMVLDVLQIVLQAAQVVVMTALTVLLVRYMKRRKEEE